MGEGGSCSGPSTEDTGRPLGTVLCPVFAVGGLDGFSCFQSFQVLVQCSALVFCVFYLVLFGFVLFFSTGV